MRWRIGTLLIPLLLVLAACSTDRFEAFEPEPLIYDDRPPLRLDVAEVTIENRFRVPPGPPHIEQTLPVAPLEATLALLRERLRAAGEAGSALAVIEDASVIEDTVGPFGGAEGDARSPSEGSQRRLRGRIEVRVIEFDASGGRSGSISTAVTRTVGLPPDASPARRRAAGHQLVQNLVDDFDRGLLENAYANLAIAGR